MLNDNVVPFKPKSPRKISLTQEQLEYLEDMYTDLTITMDNITDQFIQSDFAHGMIVVLFDSEGQFYFDISGTPETTERIKKLSTWINIFNDIHNESYQTKEVLE